MSGRATYAAFLGACSVFKKDFDRTVFVVPELIFSWQGDRLGPINSCVFIKEDASQYVTAHEIGHTYGYWDENLFLIDSLYPYGHLAGDGWDVLRVTGIARISIDPSNPKNIDNCYSFMHYNCFNCWAPSNDYWFNKYNTLLEKLGIGTDPRVAVVSGIIYENGSVDFLPFYSFDGYPDILDEGNYSFECLSLSEEVLCDVSFEAEFFTDNETGQNVSPFVFSIPYPENTSRIVLKHYNITLKEISVTQNSPQVEIISIEDFGDETYEIIWNMSDADEDNLTYSIFYSHNDEDWLPLVFSSNETNLTYLLDATNLPGSDKSSVKIIVTDGINTAEAISEPFSVSNKKPSAFISQPPNNSTFKQGDEIIFRGWAYDPEEFELNGSTFIWISDKEGIIGTGASLIISNLSIGTHNIILNVTDSDSLSDMANITINILPVISINLNHGWNLISIPLILENNSVKSVFSEIMDKIIVINSFESGVDGGARTYDPLLPEFSDLREIDYKHGYWVKMNESANLTVSGFIPENKIINLTQGWNLISYLCSEIKNVSDIFGGIISKVIVINGFENGALTYDPQLPEFSDLTELKPKFGYWVKMNETAVLDYGGVC